MAIASSSNNTSEKILWFWQSNSNSWVENERKVWKRYSDFENEFIEEAFQRKEKEVQLNNYIIDFNRSVQFKKDARNRQRAVKREQINVSQYVREERFCYPESAVVVKSFETKWNYEDSLCNQWQKNHKQISDYRKPNFSDVAELAAQGILVEGKLLGRDLDAQRMAEKLRSCTNKEEVLQCAVRLYSSESFLYKLVNSILRSNDMNKVDSLGPFCWLLKRHFSEKRDNDRQAYTLYRGVTLTDKMIEEYKQALGKNIQWLAFTSTTTDHGVAEMFSGNTLFIIRARYNFLSPNSLSDISPLSEFPHEQEVLLDAEYQFVVDKIERNSTTGKYLIYMSSAIV